MAKPAIATATAANATSSRREDIVTVRSVPAQRPHEQLEVRRGTGRRRERQQERRLLGRRNVGFAADRDDLGARRLDDAVGPEQALRPVELVGGPDDGEDHLEGADRDDVRPEQPHELQHLPPLQRPRREPNEQHLLLDASARL